MENMTEKSNEGISEELAYTDVQFEKIKKVLDSQSAKYEKEIEELKCNLHIHENLLNTNLKEMTTKQSFQIEELVKALESAKRLIDDCYMDFEKAGGPDECKHGRAEGIFCRKCDNLMVNEALEKVRNK